MIWNAVIRACVLPVVVALAWLAGPPSAAHANRFGPPWLAEVTVDRGIAHTGPSRASSPIGPLSRGDRLVILEEARAEDGGQWFRTDVGWLSLDDIDEVHEPFVAEVAVRSVSIFTKPNPGSGARRSAPAGSLLRVIGVSPGIDGDKGIWWATTEGFVTFEALQQVDNQWSREWTVPIAADALDGWWATVRSSANVRASSAPNAPVVGELVPGDRVKVLGEERGVSIGGNAIWYRIDGGRYAGGRVHSSLLARGTEPTANTTAPPADRTQDSWIVVDRRAASLTLVRHGKAEFVTYVSLGRAGVETPLGSYSTFGKYRADDMTSTSVANADRSYDFPNVPFTQYYREGGYAIHGAYWHDQFGSTASQGCINITWADAAYLFEMTRPEVDEGDNARWTEAERATPVVIVG